MSFEVNRRLVRRRPALETSAQVDSVTAGIIRGAFETICFEAATHLGRAASSAIINQSNERDASIIDAHGRLAGLSATVREARSTQQRRANLGNGFRDTPIYAGAGLEPGHTIPGPAIIEESFTTIVVYPGWSARVDDASDYLLSLEPQKIR